MADSKGKTTLHIFGACRCHTSKAQKVEVPSVEPLKKAFQQWALKRCLPMEYLTFYWNEKKLNPDESPASVGMKMKNLILVQHNPDLTFGDVELAFLLKKGAKGKVEIYSADTESGTKVVNMDDHHV